MAWNSAVGSRPSSRRGVAVWPRRAASTRGMEARPARSGPTEATGTAVGPSRVVSVARRAVDREPAPRRTRIARDAARGGGRDGRLLTPEAGEAWVHDWTGDDDRIVFAG